MYRLSKTTIVAIALLAFTCALSETASAQFFGFGVAGSYGAGLDGQWQRGNYSKGFTPSPEPLYDERGRVTGSWNPVTGRQQGQGFISPNASHYRYRDNGQLALYVPMDYGLGGISVIPGSRHHRRHHRQHNNWRW